MWSSMNNVHLIRYLIMLRVNGTLIRRPTCLSAEISMVLGSLIAQHLPTTEQRPWQDCVTAWENVRSHEQQEGKKSGICPPSWPIESVLLSYPGKMVYGHGEVLILELKLLADDADHGHFLGVILPALEEAGYTSDPRWNRPNSLWGRFDICAIHVARGSRWEPLVTEGKLDLRCQPTPRQWMEGWVCELTAQQMFHIPTSLWWLTSFDLRQQTTDETDQISGVRKDNPIPTDEIPGLQDILEALLHRLKHLTSSSEEILNLLEPEEKALLLQGIESTVHSSGQHDLRSVTKHQPGRWHGTQMFHTIPGSIVPYLELASILHIGRQTHLGCGTFVLHRAM